ncbi:MAG: hypothetical protein HYY93_09475 [Planctomycetes bacterium]|nr:hypothetical protein [Planctomycetota bacterium]
MNDNPQIPGSDDSPMDLVPNRAERKGMPVWEVVRLVGIALAAGALAIAKAVF